MLKVTNVNDGFNANDTKELNNGVIQNITTLIPEGVSNIDESKARITTEAPSANPTLHDRAFPIATAGNPIAFLAFLDRELTNLNAGSIIKFNKVSTNIGNHYNVNTGTFTVPHSGIYLFSFHITTAKAYSYVIARLVVDGKHIIDATADSAGQNTEVMGGNTAILSLSVGETVWVTVVQAAFTGGSCGASKITEELLFLASFCSKYEFA